MTRKVSTRRRVLGAIGAGAVTTNLVGGAAADEHDGDERDDAYRGDDEREDGEHASITFGDQEVSGHTQTVTIEHVYLPEPGLVDIHHSERNDDHETEWQGTDGDTYEAPLGRPVGLSEYLCAGHHYDLEVELFGHIPCVDVQQEHLLEDQWLMAMPHQDSGGDEGQYVHFCTHVGQEFDENDGGFEDADGEIVEDHAEIEVLADISFEDQTLPRRYTQAVDVEEVFLPEPGGFIDLHDPERTQEDDEEYPPLGAALGATGYLEPGTHHHVQVELFGDVPNVKFEQDRLDEGQEIDAMPHVDSDENQEFGHWKGMDGDGGWGDFPEGIVMERARVDVPEETCLPADDDGGRDDDPDDDDRDGDDRDGDDDREPDGDREREDEAGRDDGSGDKQGGDDGPDDEGEMTDGQEADGNRTDGNRTDGNQTDGNRTDGNRTDGYQTDG